MNPIRPNLPPVSPNAAPKASEATRSAAQKAFFDLALGKTPAAASPQTPAPIRAAAMQRPAPTPAEAPSRPLRPGSLLDIRV